jgi:autophagy-related protein 16
MSDATLTIRNLLLERNERETNPFLSIHQANATLLNQIDALQIKCEIADRELAALRTQLSTNPSKAGTAAAAAALKNETRLRDKLEKLQEEYNARLKTEAQEKALALETALHLAQQKDLVTAQESQLQQQQLELAQLEKAMAHLHEQVSEAQQATRLAEQQYGGLKGTIRQLQEENDSLQKENRLLEHRLVNDKKSLVEEMNSLTEIVEALKREVDMLRTYKSQEEQRKKGWFGGSKVEPKTALPSQEEGRQFGEFGVVVPSVVKQTIIAHLMEGTCLRYDPSGTGLLATASSDATVKVFDSNQGQLRATLRGSPGHSILGSDLSNLLVVGAGSGKQMGSVSCVSIDFSVV